MENDITYLGKVVRVDSGDVEIEISDKVPSSAPVINGKIYKIGQIGTFVKIPIGNITIYGVVASVSNTPSKHDDNIVHERFGSRYLTVQLVGEKIGGDEFEKGVGTYPTINDEVHLVTDDDLHSIYGDGDKESIEIGKHSSSDNLSVFINLHKLVLRHSAILGSTGSGKSNATVSIIKAIINDYIGSRVILIDPHGEYSSAFPDAQVLKIGNVTNPLYIPFWLMNFDELAFFLVGARPSDDQKPEYRQFRERIVAEKIKNVDLKSGKVDPNYVTADSPIPFDLRKLWYEMNWEINATFTEGTEEKQSKANAEELNSGDADNLVPASFKAYSMGSIPPFKSKKQIFYSYEKKMYSRLKDSRYDFLFNPGDYATKNSSKDLHNLLAEWIGSTNRLSIIDLSGVPFEVLDLTVGLIARVIYDSMFWGRFEDYTGKNRPILLAFEEAHSYLNRNDNSNYSKNAVERIFKEGRKFGVGALVISQRPSEISETILAQIGTIIALRTTNSSDQAIIRNSAPDNLNSLMNLLSSLRIGEAVVVGESIKIPSRIRIKLNAPRPTSDDPEIEKVWMKKFDLKDDDYKSVALKIRQQRI